MVNIKNIINRLEKFSQEHLQINDFGFGNIDNISTKNHDFILMWVSISDSDINLSSTNYNFEIYILDLLKQNYSNYIDILTDTNLICKDIISLFFDNQQLYGFTLNENNVNTQLIEFKFDDCLLGWKMDINVETQDGLNLCEIPYIQFIPPIPPEPFDCNQAPEEFVLSGVTYGIDDELEGTYICPVCPEPNLPEESEVLNGILYGYDFELEGTYQYPEPIIYTRLSDYNNYNTYEGFAVEGSLESESVWTITKNVTNNIGSVLSTTRFFNQKWIDRYTL